MISKEVLTKRRNVFEKTRDAKVTSRMGSKVSSRMLKDSRVP